MNWHDIITACKEAVAFIKELYEIWPAPWVLLVVCANAIPLGYLAAKYIRAIVKEFLGYEVSTARLMIYASAIAFVIGAWSGTLFEVLADEPGALWLNALAAGLLCAPIIKSSLAKLREADPTIADALDHALDNTRDDLNQTQAGGRNDER